MKNLKHVIIRRVSNLLFKLLKNDIVRIVDDELEKKLLYKYLVFGDEKNLSIHETVVVNNTLFNLICGKVTIGAYSFFGHNVSILTGSHDITKTMKERQITVPSSGRDIIIEEGVWIASNAIVIGPCSIGKNTVIGPGVIVTGIIPENTKITLSKEINKTRTIIY